MFSFEITDRIGIIRIILLLATIVFPIVGILMNFFNPKFYDPYSLRMVVSVPCLLVFIGSYTSEYIQRHLNYFMYGLGFLWIGWLQIMLYCNNLDSTYAFWTFILYTGLSMAFNNTAHFRIFSFLFFASTVATTYFIQEPLISTPNFLTLIFTLILINSIVVENLIMLDKKLMISNNNFQTFVDSVYKSYFLLDKNYSIIKADKAARKFMSDHGHRSVEEGDCILNFIPDIDKSDFLEHFKRALKGRAFVTEKEFKTPGGRIEYHRLRFLPVQDISGKIRKVLFSVNDITKEKMASMYRRRNEQRYKLLTDNIRDVIMTLESSGTIKFTTPSCLELLGMKYNQLIGTQLLDFVQPPEKELIKAFLNNQDWGAQEILTCCFKLSSPSNDKWIEANFEKIRDPKTTEIIEVISVWREVTERKQAEENLKAKNDELKKTNEELDRFVYSAAHDLRAPLTSVLGLVNIAKYETDINKIFSHLELIKRSICKLDDFIKDIIRYSKNSKTEVKIEEIHLDEMVAEIIQNLKFLNCNSSIEETIQIKSSAPFFNDKKRIEIILNNIISNSFKYADSNKPKSVLKVAADIYEDKAVIRITDNGIGIAEEYLDRIFNMFERASSQSKGSGLGLYIVKEISDKLKGNIKVKSVLGQGSQFTITLPNRVEEGQQVQILKESVG